MFRMKKALVCMLTAVLCLGLFSMAAMAMELPGLSVPEDVVAASEAPVLSAGGIVIDGSNFPDGGFCEYVKTNFDADGDGMLSPREIEAVTDIDCSGLKITSLKGLEYFSALRELYCVGCGLTELDVSKNTELTVLFCPDNSIESLDVTMLAKLENLECGNNRLTSLDVSGNRLLRQLAVYGNSMKSLSTAGLASLRTLTCENMGLESLDVSESPDLHTLYCSDNNLAELDLTNNHILRCAVQGEGIDVMYITAWDYTRAVEALSVVGKVVVDKTVTLVYPVAGDCDGDGSAGVADLTAAMKAVMGVGDTAAKVAADVNFDGTVDVLDVIRLVRQLADGGA